MDFKEKERKWTVYHAFWKAKILPRNQRKDSSKCYDRSRMNKEETDF